jgi:GGDEF domain-containing protein/prefoldin subunit 5
VSVADPIASATASLTQTLRRHLESLRRHSPAGDELYGLIAGTLRRHAPDGALTPEGIARLYAQLERYVQDPVALPAMRIRARLLQQHLAGYLPDGEGELDGGASLAQIVRPTASGDMAAGETSRDRARAGTEQALEGTIERRREQASTEVELRKRRLRALERSEKDAWKAIYDTVKDYGRLKRLWMESLDELARERDALQQQLEQATARLRSVEDMRAALHGELERLRRAVEEEKSPPKQRRRRHRLLAARAGRGRKGGPGLLKRDEFMRVFDAELERARRAGRPLAAALLEVEHPKTAEAAQDAALADAVRRCYLEEILTGLRAYDVLGLCGPGRFAILFPETAREGAVRAIEKIRKRAAESTCALDGRVTRPPTFRAALTLHAAGSGGDDAVSLIARLEAALATAGETLVFV